MKNLRVLYKNRKDTAGRWYYACKCPECGYSKEVRVDRLKSAVHLCKLKEPAAVIIPGKIKEPKPRIVKEIRYRNRNVYNSIERVMKVEAVNKAEFDKTMKSLKEIYIILN